MRDDHHDPSLLPSQRTLEIRGQRWYHVPRGVRDSESERAIWRDLDVPRIVILQSDIAMAEGWDDLEGLVVKSDGSSRARARVLNASVLPSLSSLVRLHSGDLEEVDFRFLRRLRAADFFGSPGGAALLDLPLLEDLRWVASNEVSPARLSAPALEELWLEHWPHLETLDGVEVSDNLQRLRIVRCRNLQDLSACRSAKVLDIEGSSKLNLDSLAGARIQGLSLMNCGEIPGIEVVSAIGGLEFLNLMGNTNVSGGDLTPARGLDVFCSPKRRSYRF
ncbi:MAG: hypothetical protein R3F61_14315 [Myxococcota bacterium]